MTATESTPASNPPPVESDSNASLLRTFLAAHDAPCPHCGYNLRNLTTSTCPECGASIALGLAHERASINHAWTIGYLAIAGAWGVALVMFLIMVLSAMNGYGRRESFLVSGFALAAYSCGSWLWRRSYRRILRLSRDSRRGVVVITWIVTTASVIGFLSMM